MIGRIAWAAALLALAGVATATQLDRAARHHPALAPLVPAPFQGFAAQRLTAQALLARDGPAAQAAARRLIAARPVAAEHLTLLAQSAALSGDAPRALAALEAASLRGWRDPVAQRASAEAALAQGAHTIAAQRIAAILALDVAPQEATPMLQRLLATADGRAAFAALLAQEGRWQGRLSASLAAIDPAPLADTLTRARRAGAALPCPVLEAQAARIARAGLEAQAAGFWPGDCAGD